MPPVSSLVFVVILAAWAVYLVQRWARRRDHVATARSVDRFSEAMRVLERRRSLPRPDVHESGPRSEPVPLARPAHPAVVVKRGAPSSVVRHGATVMTRAPELARARLRARIRAVALLVASLVMVTLIALSVADVISWWWSLVGVGVLAATVVGLRSTVARTGTRRARPAVRTMSAPQISGPERLTTPSSPLAAQGMAARSVVDTPRPDHRHELSVSSAEESAEEKTAEAPGTWTPVPVPPPTYTLKASVPRPAPAPAPEPDHLPEAAPGTIPVDGRSMALDEEFEDLPPVRRVG